MVSAVVLASSVGFLLGGRTSAQAASATQVDVWWPDGRTVLSGMQPFKTVVAGMPVTSYTMYWQVDGGRLNSMPDNYTDWPHKEVSVDVSGWHWHGSGPYAVNFVAKEAGGTVLGSHSVSVTIGNGPSAVAALSSPAPSQSPTVSAASVTTAGGSLYVDPASEAATQAAAWLSGRAADASEMQKIAGQSHAFWFGNWNSNVSGDVGKVVSAAATKQAVPVLVAYNLPQRDCGGYSAGGTTPDAYKTWIGQFASAIGSNQALVILEPDSLAQLTCLSSADQSTRLSLLQSAVQTLKSHAGVRVYLDAGNPHWVAAADIAGRLKQAGVTQADGFSLNVSNFASTSDNLSFGKQVSDAVGGKHFVVDTSRNGLGPTSDSQWCNPNGRALGAKPTLSTGQALADAYLWIKYPGESDGSCNGGPAAGQWWADYALGLAQRAAY
jgi:endoglucanase